MKKSSDRQAFAEWLADQLTRRGYDLSMRGGGRGRFAAESGISASTIGRFLRGDDFTPDIGNLGLLAQALRLPLGEVLVRAGILDESELRGVQEPTPGTRHITPEEAADELGITDPQARAVFIATTEALQRQRPAGASDDRRAG